MTVTKADLVEHVAETCEISREDSFSLVADFLEVIKASLEKGDPVKLTGFGTFTVRDKGARPGRNPRTGELVEIAPRRVVTFKMGNFLKDYVQDPS
jgi:integration host factor subunit alpha